MEVRGNRDFWWCRGEPVYHDKISSLFSMRGGVTAQRKFAGRPIS